MVLLIIFRRHLCDIRGAFFKFAVYTRSSNLIESQNIARMHAVATIGGGGGGGGV